MNVELCPDASISNRNGTAGSQVVQYLDRYTSGLFSRSHSKIRSPAEVSPSSLVVNNWITGLERFGNGRIARERGKYSPFPSPSESEDDESEEFEADDPDDVLYVARLGLLEKDASEDELETECFDDACRCSNTPRPKSISMMRSSASSMCSISMLRGSLCKSSALDRSISGRNCCTLASNSVGGSTEFVLRIPKSKDRSGDSPAEALSPFNLPRIC